MSTDLVDAVGNTVTISVPLDPARWSDYNGEFGNASPDVNAKFDHVASNVERIGLSFGGGCFFSNTVGTSSGSASFVLRDFAVKQH